MQVLKDREKQIVQISDQKMKMSCSKHSTAGSVSQRACVFCGSRVVLYPVADALHLVHGPIGCAAYTWDIRGALSSGPEINRYSFSTDLREKDVIFGGEKKLEAALFELIERYKPKAAFVYSTCIVGLIGDDVKAICRKVAQKTEIPILPVHSEGFKGTKKDGYFAACLALMNIVGSGDTSSVPPVSINILGEFNIAGEAWMIRDYYKKMGIDVVSIMTGDGRVGDIAKAHGAALNVVQCSGSMMSLAKMMEEKYGTPWIRVSYFGIEDMAEALYKVADHFSSKPDIAVAAGNLIRQELQAITPLLESYRQQLHGKKAAIYVGGGFKAFSLIKALANLGMQTVVVGSQTGSAEDYESLAQICGPGTIILDDSNPVELANCVLMKDVDLFIGGVKERPLAYKLGVGFCDHNHERKKPLAGFLGMKLFAEEVFASVMSPVWQFSPRREVQNVTTT